MRRLVFLGLGGIALLAAGSIATVLYLDTRGDGRAAVPAAAPTALEAKQRPAAAGATGGSGPGPPARPAAPASPARPPPVVAQAGAWEAIEPTSIHSWPRLASSLEVARPRLAPCFDEETQARYGPRQFSAVGRPRPGTGSSVLLLQLEVAPSGLFRVVDAPVEVRGAEQDGLFTCVQAALRGMELPGQGPPGARYRIRYPLPAMKAGLPAKQIRGPRVRLRR